MNDFEIEPFSRFVPRVDEAANFFCLPLLVADNNFIARREKVLDVIIMSHLTSPVYVLRVEEFNPRAAALADNFNGAAAARLGRQQIEIAPVVVAYRENISAALEHEHRNAFFKVGAAKATDQRFNLLESFSLGTNFFKKRGVEVEI